VPERDPDGERAAFEAAERLVREAHRRAEEAAREAARDVPPNGWQAPGADGSGRPAGGALGDLGALLALVDGLRGTLPPELARPLADARRTHLLANRAVLDFAIATLEQPEEPRADVEDIPID
jgi:hypothetical protein